MSIVGVAKKGNNRKSCRGESPGTIFCTAEKERASELAEDLHAADLLGDEDRISRLNFFRWHKGCGPDGRFLTKCCFMSSPLQG